MVQSSWRVLGVGKEAEPRDKLKVVLVAKPSKAITMVNSCNNEWRLNTCNYLIIIEGEHTREIVNNPGSKSSLPLSQPSHPKHGTIQSVSNLADFPPSRTIISILLFQFKMAGLSRMGRKMSAPFWRCRLHLFLDSSRGLVHFFSPGGQQ